MKKERKKGFMFCKAETLKKRKKGKKSTVKLMKKRGKILFYEQNQRKGAKLTLKA